MIPTHTNSLVKYDNPVLVVKGAAESRSPTKEKALPGAKPKLPPVVADDKTGKAAAKAPTQTEDILNSILPPRQVLIDLPPI